VLSCFPLSMMARIDRTARNLAARLEREALLGPNPLQGMHFPELLLSKLLKVA
jgi:hypothetical protein